MQPLTIVKDFNVVKDSRASLLARLEATGMNQFCLERGKEAFHRRVVVDVTRAAHATRDFVRQELQISVAGVLFAAVRMMEQVAAGLATGQRHLQRVARQAVVQVGSHAPADNQTRVNVHNDSQVEPTLHRGNKRNVSQPLAIGRWTREILGQQVWRDRQVMPRLGGTFEAAAPYASQSFLTHQSRDPVLAHDLLLAHKSMDTSVAIYRTMFFMQQADQPPQYLVGQLTTTRFAFQPGIVAGARAPSTLHMTLMRNWSACRCMKRNFTCFPWRRIGWLF